MNFTFLKFVCIFCGICTLFIALNVPAIVWFHFVSNYNTTHALDEYFKIKSPKAPPDPWFVKYAPLELLVNRVIK